MKSVLISIQPYWVFLIIAKTMGWKIDKEKTIEVRKNFPKAEDWNKLVEIYCSKDRKSFNRIPKEYQPLMKQFLGKVVGKWVSDKIDEYFYDQAFDESMGFFINKYGYEITSYELGQTCLSYEEFEKYGNTNMLYGWHISDLKIYEKPKELSEFFPIKPKRVEKWVNKDDCAFCKYHRWGKNFTETCLLDKPEPICEYTPPLERPPQSWCYVEIGE